MVVPVPIEAVVDGASIDPPFAPPALTAAARPGPRAARPGHALANWLDRAVISMSPVLVLRVRAARGVAAPDGPTRASTAALTSASAPPAPTVTAPPPPLFIVPVAVLEPS